MNTLLAEALMALAAAAGLFVFGYHLGGISSKEKAEAASVTQLSALAKAYQDREVEHQEKVAGYDKELTTLAVQRTSVPDVSVRLCPSAPRVVVSAAGEGRQELPTSPGVLQAIHVPDSPGRDVGPPLFSLSDYADQIVAKCRAD